MPDCSRISRPTGPPPLFATPDEQTLAQLEKAWARQNLDLYLKRWEHCQIPRPPRAFFEYGQRACDIGCGFGKYLIEQSRIWPEWGFLGIDKGRLRGGKMIDRFRTAGNANLFGLHGNATPILALLGPESLDVITIFYPNPWWPRKHRQKRWSYHPLLPHLTHLLKPGGTLLLTSNETFYLSEWLYAVTHHPQVDDMRLVYAGPVLQEKGRTHFECKFLAEGTYCGEIRFRKA